MNQIEQKAKDGSAAVGNGGFDGNTAKSSCGGSEPVNLWIKGRKKL